MAGFVTIETLKSMIYQAENAGVFLCGIDKNGQLTGLGKELNMIGRFDLSSEKFVVETTKKHRVRKPTTTTKGTTTAGTRVTGRYFFEFAGEKIFCSSNKQLLRKALIYLEERKPGTLELLQEVSPRSKRIVSKDKYKLFKAGRNDLAENNSEILIDDWWVGTNNSSQEVEAWIKRACEIAGFSFGSQFKIGLSRAGKFL